MRRLILMVSIVLLFLLLLISWYSYRFFYHPLNITEKSLIITVPPNVGTEGLAFNLYKQGILQDPFTFTLFAKKYPHFKQIKVGDYRLESGITPSQLLQKLLKGDVLMYKITFIEGWTFKQFMNAIQTNVRLTHTLKDTSQDTVMASIGHLGENPEGMFFPDTYFFANGTKDTQILKIAYHLMQTRLNRAWQNRDSRTSYRAPYEALIVASMIEREAVTSEDRPQIAGVILRRLQKQMPLQIDATVIYGLRENYKGILKRDNLKTDTPYNTYTRRGLPPTPISMPGMASIQAALHPADGIALYYVAKGDGSHIFSENLQAHNSAIAKYLLPLQALAEQKRMQAAEDLLKRMTFSHKLMICYWSFVGGGSSVRHPSMDAGIQLTSE